MAKRGEEPGVRMVCGACGSGQVVRDAWAEWNEGLQAWQLGAVFDHAWCHRCQSPARIVQRAL